MAPFFVFFQNFSVLADVPVPAFSFANDLALSAAIAVGNWPVRLTLEQYGKFLNQWPVPDRAHKLAVLHK